MGLPAVAYAAGRLAPAGAGRGGAFAGAGPPVGVAGMPTGDGPVAGGVGAAGGGGSGGAAHVPPLWHVSGGAIGAHRSGSHGTSRRGRGALGHCDRARTPSRLAPGLPMGATRRGPTPPGAAGVARRPTARVAVGGILSDGAPAVGQPTAVAARGGPCDIRGAGPGLRGPRGTGTPGPQRPPAAGGDLASTHQGPSAENGPGCVAAASAGRGPPAGQGGVDGEVSPAAGGLQVCGAVGAPAVCLPRSHAVSNEAAGGALPRAMDAALGAAGKGKAGYVLAGLPAAGGTGAAATAAISVTAAPAGAPRPARGGRRERGARGGAAARGPAREAPGPALCRLRAARGGALLLAGARRAPH